MHHGPTNKFLASIYIRFSPPLVIHPQHSTMALSMESKALLQAQVELWNKTLSFMKSVALAVALDLRITDAIRHHGGAATLPQILAGIGISPCKLASLRRLMRVLTVAGTFAI